MNERLSSSPIKVLLVDDQTLVRAGFRMIIEAAPDLRVVGEAENGREAISEARRLRPDVVLLDIQMPVMSGLDAIPELGETKVIVLTTFENDEYVYEALRRGASGFLLKNTPPEELVLGIRAVARGGALLSPSITRSVIEQFSVGYLDSDAAGRVERLSEREREVLGLVARGLSNAEIAGTLFLSEETIKSHVSNIFGKLEISGRVQAVVFAYEAGLVRPGQAGSPG
jgi:DNA-binding NarL/FixJ family response regulator